MATAQVSVPLAHSSMSTQMPAAFLSYPVEQEQEKEPIVLTQVSVGSAQVSIPAAHSLTSTHAPDALAAYPRAQEHVNDP